MLTKHVTFWGSISIGKLTRTLTWQTFFHVFFVQKISCRVVWIVTITYDRENSMYSLYKRTLITRPLKWIHILIYYSYICYLLTRYFKKIHLMFISIALLSRYVDLRHCRFLKWLLNWMLDQRLSWEQVLLY